MAYIGNGEVLAVTTTAGAGAAVLPQTGASSLSVMAIIAATVAAVMIASRVITRAAARR
jgi:LPXTG-motif cell wall-anchored protein